MRIPSSDAVLEIIREVADEVIRPRFRNLEPDQIDEKHPGDPVTIADREAEEHLTRWLNQQAPGALVVGEEAVYLRPDLPQGLATAEVAYTVDPVDGTRNFASGSPDYAVMVAETRRGVTTRAWLWQPEHGRAFVAEAGAGATLNGEPLARLQPSPTPRGASSRRELVGAHLSDHWPPVVPTRWCCGIDYPMVATGDIDYLCYWNLQPWDHLPGALMVAELGGVTLLLDGTGYTGQLGRKGLVCAASDEIAAQVLSAGQVVPSLGKL